MKPAYTFDIECYRNYFLALFVNVEDGSHFAMEMFNSIIYTENLTSHNLPDLLYIGFNSYKYDLPMLTAYLAGFSNEKLKEVSDRLILDGMMPWEFESAYGLTIPSVDHIDLIEVAPGKASLKLYGGRMGSGKLQDLPIEPDATIQATEVELLRRYCYNDNRVTADLYRTLTPQLELRQRLGEEYGVNLMSKSDAQIAEAVIRHEYQIRTGEKLYKPTQNFVGVPMHYTPPPFIQFRTQQMKDLLAEIMAAEFIVEPSGKLIMPECLKQTIEVAGRRYKMGVGGLHSIDAPGEFRAGNGMVLEDVDVASYYPSIILNAGFYPKHIGPVFLDIYRALVDKRLAAKHSGDKVTADSLKITINGTFGKLGSKWSYIYSPDLMFHVTVTGQLALLMLIEQLQEQVISANTDGLTLYHSLASSVRTPSVLIGRWMQETGFRMETTPYARLNRRDISNYIAITQDGKVKAKGMFADEGMMKNPTNLVCIDAVKAFIQHNTPVEQTIWECNDIKRFLTVRTVNGGAVKDGQLLGKAIRWYYSNRTFTGIHYKTNGNTVARSEGAMPLMDLPDGIPADLDRKWYIHEAEDILDSIGA